MIIQKMNNFGIEKKTDKKKNKIQVANQKVNSFLKILLFWRKIPKLYLKSFQKNALVKNFRRRLLQIKFSKKKKEIVSENSALENSSLAPFFFKPWLTGQGTSLTKRQIHLKELLVKLEKNLSLENKKDFWKSHFGSTIQTLILHGPSSDITNSLLFSRKFIKFLLARVKTHKDLEPSELYKSHREQYEFLIKSLQKAWLYQNLFEKKKQNDKASFDLDRPNTAFQNHFRQQNKEPWIDALIFKRWAYFGFIERNRKENRNQKLKLKAYLRKRNPRFQKKNKLYWWRRKLLFSFYTNNRIKKHKAKRIKQVLGKIYFSFYGNLKKKQFQKILKKNNRKKSKLLNKNEKILSFLENRLDVVVYRLNLAPSILWSRRLIQEGSIFISNTFSFQSWILMYSQLKYFLFPLKLRDPKNLYKSKYWDPNQNTSKLKFLLKPMKKIHYLVQPGDLIQSAKTLRIKKMKINSRLFQKPIQNNIYTAIKTKKYFWKNPTSAPKAYSSFKELTPTAGKTTAVFLFHTQFTDLSKNDRAKELFFRWITL